MAESWSILSKHGVALVCVARDPGIRVRDLADCMQVSDRTAFGVLDDLIEAGYLRRHKQGNRNRYEVDPDKPMPHPTVRDHSVGDILAILVPDGRRRTHEFASRDAA
jgi:hypothetical protein